MATKGKDGFLKVRKESTGRPPIDGGLVSLNISVTVADKEFLESFGKGKKSEKAREIFKKAREIFDKELNNPV